MRINEKSIGIRGNVSYVLHDKNGNVKQSGESENLATDLHEILVADRLAGGSDALFTHGHAGTGTGQTESDTNLDSYFDEARTAVTSSTQGAGADAQKVTVIYTLGAGVCTGTINEIGIFSSANQATADMKAYSDNGGAGYAIVKGASDTLTVTWVFTYEAS